MVKFTDTENLNTFWAGLDQKPKNTTRFKYEFSLGFLPEAEHSSEMCPEEVTLNGWGHSASSPCSGLLLSSGLVSEWRARPFIRRHRPLLCAHQSGHTKRILSFLF